jgi:sugar phosphate isomerase/epimerase
VHVKDVRPDIMAQASAEDWSFLDAVLGKADAFGIYTVPGDGMVDYTRFFKALSPYSGWVILEAEQDPLKATILQMRSWDEAAKDPHAQVPSLESYRDMLESLLSPVAGL